MNTIKNIRFIILFVFHTLQFKCQEPSIINKYIIQFADSLYKQKKYEKTSEIYTSIIRNNQWKGSLELICKTVNSWSQIGNFDSSFFCLESVIKNNDYLKLNYLNNELILIQKDKRWKNIVEQIISKNKKFDSELNYQLIELLDRIFINDQKYRVNFHDSLNNTIFNASQSNSFHKEIKYLDSLNLITIDSLIEKYGWLGTKTIGKKGNQTLFLVIQHSDLKTQEKYLPIMKQSVHEGKLNPSYMAFLEDRVNLQNGRRQVYGTQIGKLNTGQYYLLPTEELKNIDQRRLRIGLPPIAEYLSHWNIKLNNLDSIVFEDGIVKKMKSVAIQNFITYLISKEKNIKDVSIIDYTDLWEHHETPKELLLMLQFDTLSFYINYFNFIKEQKDTIIKINELKLDEKTLQAFKKFKENLFLEYHNQQFDNRKNRELSNKLKTLYDQLNPPTIGYYQNAKLKLYYLNNEKVEIKFIIEYNLNYGPINYFQVD